MNFIKYVSTIHEVLSLTDVLIPQQMYMFSNTVTYCIWFRDIHVYFVCLDRYCNGRIMKFDKHGKLLHQWGRMFEGIADHKTIKNPKLKICVNLINVWTTIKDLLAITTLQDQWSRQGTLIFSSPTVWPSSSHVIRSVWRIENTGGKSANVKVELYMSYIHMLFKQ